MERAETRFQNTYTEQVSLAIQAVADLPLTNKFAIRQMNNSLDFMVGIFKEVPASEPQINSLLLGH